MVETMRKVSGMVLIPVDIYLFKVNGINTKARREIYAKLAIQISKRHQ